MKGVVDVAKKITADGRLKQEMARIKKAGIKLEKVFDNSSLSKIVELTQGLKFKVQIDDYLLSQKNSEVYYEITNDNYCFSLAVDDDGNPTKNISIYIEGFESESNKKWGDTGKEERLLYARKELRFAIDQFLCKVDDCIKKIE